MTVAVGAMLFFLDFGRKLSYYLAIRIYQSILDYIVRRTYSQKVYTRIQRGTMLVPNYSKVTRKMTIKIYWF